MYNYMCEEFCRFSQSFQKGVKKFMADNRNNQNRNRTPNYNTNRNPQNRNQNYNQAPNRNKNNQQEVKSPNGLSPTIKGIIAIMLTMLIVVIIIMIFAKTLFMNNSSEPKKTGTITSTEYIAPVTTTTEAPVTSMNTKKTTTKAKDEDPYDGTDDGDGVEITCTGAVYLHPEASSSSATLLTIPSGATCTFYKNENGWYYVEYNGTKGYAWQTFFTAPVTTNAY